MTRRRSGTQFGGGGCREQRRCLNGLKHNFQGRPATAHRCLAAAEVLLRAYDLECEAAIAAQNILDKNVRGRL